jgi:hypothetical protein
MNDVEYELGNYLCLLNAEIVFCLRVHNLLTVGCLQLFRPVRQTHVQGFWEHAPSGVAWLSPTSDSNTCTQIVHLLVHT